VRLTQVAPEEMSGYVGLAECLFRLERDAEADGVIARARARFGDAPELVMLVARQLLRRDAFAEAEALLAPLTEDERAPRSAEAWAWIAVSRLARKDQGGAFEAARQSLAIDPANAVARSLSFNGAR